MSRTILIASGGTGGHLYPTIAIADEVRKLDPSASVIFVGTQDRIEAKEVPRAGYPFMPIDIEAPRKSLGSMLQFPVKMVKAILECRRIIKQHGVTAFLGGGAYLSVPAGVAAWLSGVPVGLLEINSIGGTANKLLSRVAKRVFLAYPESRKDFSSVDEASVTISGTPVRHGLGNTISPASARRIFGLSEERPTLLAFGGSLGARAINETMETLATKFDREGYNVIWQTGKSASAQELQSRVGGAHVRVQEYIFEMDQAYAAADLVIARSGASTLAELSQLGKPAVLVPYPHASDNHQEHNAKAFEHQGAAVVLRDAELKEKLFDTVNSIMRDADRRARMATAMRSRENAHASRIVADWLLENG